MHDHLNKLRLISKIREGQSLCTNNEFTVYEFTYLNWLYRKWNRDGKDEVVKTLQDFYRSVDQSSDRLIGEIKHSKDDDKKKKLIYTAISLARNIKSSLRGIEQLAKTYSAYQKTTAVLEGIVHDFATTTYTQLIKIIPTDLQPAELKGHIEYNGIVIYGDPKLAEDVI